MYISYLSILTNYHEIYEIIRADYQKLNNMISMVKDEDMNI